MVMPLPIFPPEEEVSRDAFRAQFVKTELCRFYTKHRCSKGLDCPFAHGRAQLVESPDLTKTSLCQKWMEGTCELSRHECTYAHGKRDLKTTEVWREHARLAARTSRQRAMLTISGGSNDSMGSFNSSGAVRTLPSGSSQDHLTPQSTHAQTTMPDTILAASNLQQRQHNEQQNQPMMFVAFMPMSNCMPNGVNQQSAEVANPVARATPSREVGPRPQSRAAAWLDGSDRTDRFEAAAVAPRAMPDSLAGYNDVHTVSAMRTRPNGFDHSSIYEAAAPCIYTSPRDGVAPAWLSPSAMTKQSALEEALYQAMPQHYED